MEDVEHVDMSTRDDEQSSSEAGIVDGNLSVDVGKLKPAVHQVAGHGSTGRNYGRMGPVVDDSGRFYKPLHEGNERADREIAFYNEIKSEGIIPAHVLHFFPKFFGVKYIPSMDGLETVRYGVMENLTHGFDSPSVADVKIGYRTWYPEAGEKYIKKSMLKDKLTTSGALGLRISGMQVYEPSTGEIWKPDRSWCRYMTAETVRPTLERFVSTNPSSDSFDGAFATSVYGGSHGVLAQLEELKEWFNTQAFYHFASTSVLIIYEGSCTSHGDAVSTEAKRVSVKLVDFAHSVKKNSVDDNFLAGLKSLMNIISSILEYHTSS